MCSAIELESFKARADRLRHRLRTSRTQRAGTDTPTDWLSDDEINTVIEADRDQPAAR